MNNFEVVQDTDFAKLVITYRDLDAKNIDDMKYLCKEVGFNVKNLTSNIQIHSDKVVKIDENNICEKQEADALVTSLEEVPLLIFTADCVPLAFIDKENKAIGLAHAGWKGTYGEIGKRTIELMQESYNTNPKDLLCVIGPSIGPCCYEVSDELVDKFNTNFTTSGEKFYTIKDGNKMLDLWKINEYSIKSSGVPSENIINLGLCTSCQNDKFHSYRLDNKTSKRIGMLLQIK